MLVLSEFAGWSQISDEVPISREFSLPHDWLSSGLKKIVLKLYYLPKVQRKFHQITDFWSHYLIL